MILSGLLVILLLGVLAVLGLAVALLAYSIRATRARQDQRGGLGEESAWSLRPIQELRKGIEALAASGTSPEVVVIAQEALVEAESVERTAAGLLRTREQLRASSRGAGFAKTNLDRLQRQWESAGSDEERASLQSAIEARRSEVAVYEQAKQRIAEIDGKLREGEAALAELKAKLSAGSVQVSAPEAPTSEFNDLVARLKSLSRSFEEAQDMTETKTT